jgi:adenosine kinase
MIIITGSIAYDYIMDFPGKFGDHILPEQIHNVNLSFIVSNFQKHRGGTAGNVSFAMNLLKTPHLLYSFAGKDFDTYQEELAKLGIKNKGVQIDKTLHTATGFALNDKASNQIWGYYYGAASKNLTLDLEKVAKANDLVLIGPQGAKASMKLINQCVKLKLDYMFDPGFILTEISDKDLRLGIKMAKFIIGNEYEIELMKKRIETWDSLTKNKIIITTLGEKGALIKAPDSEFKINPCKVEKVASTAGAGDAWRGGFLAGLHRGFSLKICGQIGCTASSFVVENFGTQEYFYTTKQFEARYRQTYNGLLKL